MDSVVVPAVSVPSSYACFRSLSPRGVNTIAVSERESPEVFCSRYCNETLRVPSPREDPGGYVSALLELAKRMDVKTIIPVREEDVLLLSLEKDEFSKYIETPWPRFEELRRVQDRVRLSEAAEAANVSMPETRLLTECEDWSRPWVVKGRYSILGGVYADTVSMENGGGESLITDRVDGGLSEPPSTEYLEAGQEPDIETLCAEAGHVPIVQEYVPEVEEYSFCALYDQGDALATFQHRQVRGFSYIGGSSTFRKSVNIPDLEGQGLKLLDQLDWHGLAEVECKRDPDTGEFKIMEVNPRFWASVPAAVRAGADFPLYYWLLTTGRRGAIEPGYEIGVGDHLLRGELFYLSSVLRGEDNRLVDRPSVGSAVTEVLSSVVRHPNFDYVDVSDPCPFLRNMFDLLEGGLD